jgi:hypothetical protein
MAEHDESARRPVDDANGNASVTPSSPPAPGPAAKDPGAVLAELYAQRRAKVAETPQTKDPRAMLAELAAAQRASVAQEPTAKDPRQLLRDLAAEQRVRRARGQNERDDSTAATPAVPAATLPSDAPPMDQPASPPIPGEEELERRRVELDRQERRLADLERQLAERVADLEVQRNAMPAPTGATGDAAPVAGPSAPTLSARLRARKRELGELPPTAPVPPEPSMPPGDLSPAAVIPPIPGADQPASPPEQDSAKDRDGEPYDRRRRWLLVLPILAVLILGLQAIVLLRPHGPRAAATVTIALPTARIAVPTATVAAQTSTASIAATPILTAPVAAVLTAASVAIVQSTATALPTAIPSPVPTTVPATVPTTAPPSPAPTTTATTAPAMALLSRVANAEAALRSGQFAATIDDGNGTRATATLVFDLGNGTPPRLHLTATYASPAGTQSSEQITIGDQAWQRQANGQWAPAAPQGIYESVQPYLPHVASVANAALAGGGSTLNWYDASRAVDVTLSVDAATGIPLTLQEAPREGGARRTTTYSAWNAPVDIRPPPST